MAEPTQREPGTRNGEVTIHAGAVLTLMVLDKPSLSVDDVRALFDCSRATAYRRIAAVRAAIAEVRHA